MLLLCSGPSKCPICSCRPRFRHVAPHNPSKWIRLSQTNPIQILAPIYATICLQTRYQPICQHYNRVRFAETHVFTLPRAAHSSESLRSLGEGGCLDPNPQSKAERSIGCARRRDAVFAAIANPKYSPIHFPDYTHSPTRCPANLLNNDIPSIVASGCVDTPLAVVPAGADRGPPSAASRTNSVCQRAPA